MMGQLQKYGKYYQQIDENESKGIVITNKV